MIHLSIIFSEDYITQLKRPFLINSTMYLFLSVNYSSDALIFLAIAFFAVGFINFFCLLTPFCWLNVKVTVNLQFNNLEELVIEKGQHMFWSPGEADVVETSKYNFSQIPYTSMI